MTKIALITGITGQDGSYLTEFLIKKKYKVWDTESYFIEAIIENLWWENLINEFFEVIFTITISSSLGFLFLLLSSSTSTILLENFTAFPIKFRNP